MKSVWRTSLSSLAVLALAAAVLGEEESGTPPSTSSARGPSVPVPAAPAESPTLDAIRRRHAAHARAAAPGPARELAGAGDGGAVWSALLEGNRRFASSAKSLARARSGGASDRAPRAMVLACSDSAAAPELLFDQGLGDLFVVRTAGPVADALALGSLEYAAERLHPKVLVVLGHEGCQAVTDAASGDAPSTPAAEALIARIQPALDGLRPRLSGPELTSAGVQAHVAATVVGLLRESESLRRQVEAGELIVIGAVYHPETGRVIELR